MTSSLLCFCCVYLSLLYFIYYYHSMGAGAHWKAFTSLAGSDWRQDIYMHRVYIWAGVKIDGILEGILALSCILEFIQQFIRYFTYHLFKPVFCTGNK